MQAFSTYSKKQVATGITQRELYGIISMLPDNDYRSILLGKDDMLGRYDALVAWGANEVSNSFGSLSEGLWWFGHIPYDAHEEWSGVSSQHTPFIGFPKCTFFSPRFVLAIQNGCATLHYLEGDQQEADRWWASLTLKKTRHGPDSKMVIIPKMSRKHYLDAVSSLKVHLKRGDIYEVNYCQFFNGEASLHPLRDFTHWMSRTSAPFSALYQCNRHYLFSASPERFICKRNNRLYAQPIKGTAPRHSNPEMDDAQKKALKNSEKERAENVMIVDLMRNDLSRIAQRDSVVVEELFGIYSFSQVHQMISTISASVLPGVGFSDIIQSTFPMGSMTGAPKHSAMMLIDQHETQRRELFSGSVGYIEPNGDFDFNVVIRSLQYNDELGIATAGAGSAITYLSDSEMEYEECLWKLSTIKKITSP